MRFPSPPAGRTAANFAEVIFTLLHILDATDGIARRLKVVIAIAFGRIVADAAVESRCFIPFRSRPIISVETAVHVRAFVNDARWNGYTVPPTSNANYGWILNIVSKLSQNGVAGFLLANGALSDDGTELKIRQQLIENHLVEAIIILPRNLFYTTDISVTLWVLNKNKKARVVEQNGKLKRYRDREDEILFMDLRQMGSPYEKKYIELTEEDRAKVTSVYHNWQQEGYEETYENVPEFCYSASFDEVKEKGFTLVPSRYIEFVNRDENIDFDTKMKSLQGELKELLAQEEKSKEDLLSVFKELGYEIEI